MLCNLIYPPIPQSWDPEIWWAALPAGSNSFSPWADKTDQPGGWADQRGGSWDLLVFKRWVWWKHASCPDLRILLRALTAWSACVFLNDDIQGEKTVRVNNRPRGEEGGRGGAPLKTGRKPIQIIHFFSSIIAGSRFTNKIIFQFSYFGQN